MDRKPAVAGKFYPQKAAELQNEIERLFSITTPGKGKKVRALIAPHAGYIFSGGVAASAFAQIDRGTKYKRVFVIGSSHTVGFKGASIFCEGDFLMPYGKEIVDTKLGRELTENYPSLFTSNPSPHINEHSLEVQLPFVNYLLKSGYTIVPIIIGTDDPTICREIAKVLKPFFIEENLFVISTDFSHYPGYKDANETDSITKSAILTNDPSILLKALKENYQKRIKGLSTSLCGASAVLVLMNITEGNPKIKYGAIDYKNSGDNSYYGDKERVVGYWAITVCEEPLQRSSLEASAAGFEISADEKESLLRIAKESIDVTVLKRGKNRIRVKDTSGVLSATCGVFVTLHKKGRLRGCIGRIESNIPLYKAVEEVAALTAYYDSRFPPVGPDELKDLEIEISVLSPPVKIRDISQIKPGVHGIIIRRDNRSGVFLPQVALETGWSLEEYLGHCSRDKAGIGWDGWKSADIYIFTATVLQ
ncbi:MAG: hypothetical protein A2X17_07140 [Bacteroidetes bacterium GWF2_41_61]|nr:MAG: hypothetical protein A2X17_07140 [Bacteroidetes bacterium GWF2_41_61]HBG23892.1 TIGR00296 family protein [Rikenellaceae bacterium]